ncbi:uncharacterized protein V6R79_010332 [Siganus canaliculatus]
MARTVCVPMALLTLLLLTLLWPSGWACPRSCNCYQASEVHCTFRSLLTIPPGLPAHTRRINLGFNSISRIYDSSLSGLKKVELLMLHSNDLNYLPDAAFRDLKSLQILKLSYNKLREISSSLTFSGLTSLLRLYLDHNLLQYIHPRALLQLPSLRLLRLQGNRLHQLHPHTLCTLSLLNTYYFSTLRHLDLSNNSLTTLPRETLVTTPLLETLVLQPNPWSCDCRMNWFLSWSLAHPGLMKCPGSPHCPVCGSPKSLQGQGLLEQTDLLCTSPVIHSSGRDASLEEEISEIQSSDYFREPLGYASLSLSDQQGHHVDLSCNITHSSDSQDITPPPDLSLTSSSPLPLALSLSLDCPVDRRSYEELWRILAYYSETAVRLEREIMLSKAPALAYRYRQAIETDGYYHTGVKASVKATPHWLLQPAISIQLNRAQSNGVKVQLIYSTRVSTPPDPTFQSSSSDHPWVLISTNHTTTSQAAVAGAKVELPCPLLSSSNPRVQWILPDGSKHFLPSNSLDGRLWTSSSGLMINSVQLSDAGIYYCVAWAGSDVDVLPLRLAVEESSVPHSGEQVGVPVTGTVGKPVSLTCKASGSPVPYMSWVLPDGNIIRRGLAVSGGLTILPNGSLSLSNPSQRDAGNYRCIAVNQYGSDSLSMQLQLKLRHPSLLRTSFPKGPQSAAGQSTKILVPLLHQVEEGSGAEEDDKERTLIVNRRRPRPLLPPNRRYPAGNPRRRGPVREGLLRRGGGPVSSTDQRRNRFVTTNKQRLDPQKWADLLAKIRQKTANTDNSQSIAAGKPTAEPVEGGKGGDNESHEGVDDTERSRPEGAGVEAETEGSSVDDADLQEESLQTIRPILTQIQTRTQAKQATETDTEITKGTVRETEIPADLEDVTETHTQTETKPETQNEPVTSKPVPGKTENVSEPGERNELLTNVSPTTVRPQKPRQGLIHNNKVPNSRPQSPWNSRRRIGQRRRIISRPRGRPLSPPQPLPDPTNQKPQTVTPDTATNQIDMLLPASITTSPAMLSTQSSHTGNVVAISNTVGTSTLASLSPSSVASLPPSHTKTHIDLMTHSTNFPDAAESTITDTPTPAPTQSNAVPETHTETAHGTETHTKTHSDLGKHVDRAPSKHGEEQEKNLLGVPYVSHSSTSILPPLSSIASTPAPSVTTTAKTTTPIATAKLTHSTSAATSASTTTRSKDTLPTRTISPETTSPVTSTTTTTSIPTSTATTTTTTSIPTSTATTTTTTSIPTSTATTTSTTTTTPPNTTTTTTTSTTTSTTTTTTHSFTSSTTAISLTSPSTTAPTTTTTTTTASTTGHSSSTMSLKATPTALDPTTSTATTAKTTTTATPTTSSTLPSTPSASTTTMTSTRTSVLLRERPSVGQGTPVSGAPNQRRPTTDWKNPGANSIPDSHSSRPQRPPSHPLPAAPLTPVLRSRPRIADPHIRTVSFPAESTARLSCEAQGEPKPSITWTKVATGAVMSIHSRAQRFEVFPNGTLVIQNVQLQDRGTYICSAHSFLGRDRLLTTLEVWTRPPRMQVASYRDTTIHQGGDIHLECQADGVPTPLLSWVLPDRSVLTSTASSTGRIIMDTNGTLHISVTLPGDRGVYRCVASNSAGAASSSVRLHVSSLPPVILQPREEHLLLSAEKAVYIHCSARGAPPPTLRWRIPDGTLVRPSQFLHDNLFVLPNGTLHIQKVGLKDSGNYECTASNAVGADKRTVKIEVAGRRKEEEGGRGGVRNEGAKAVASEKPSASSSVPLSSSRLSPPLLHDRSKNLPLTPNLSHSSSAQPHQPTNTPPSISKTVTAASHGLVNKTQPSSLSPPPTRSSNYTKPSSDPVNNPRPASLSPFDRSKASAVIPSPVSPFSKARIVSTSPSISTFPYGSLMQLHCSVTGNPTPIVIWRTPGRKLVDVHFSFDRRLKVHPNGTLSIQAVTEKEAGDYLCITRNKVADDYRLLRVTVATKPAKIEPKQPLDQMVLLGKPLKVDCQASGLPDPAVRWSLPDGTMVNSVLQGEDRGGRARRLTVFDNGTLLVPAVGVREEGEYTCYAENQGGQDTMKVKVKVMMTSPPTFSDERSYSVIKVRQGGTATIRCQATGDPAPIVTWFSPTNRVIPRSVASGFYPERIVVVSDGTLEVRLAQKYDAGNYTCRASNSVGGRSMVVGLEVEVPQQGVSHPVGGRGWSANNGPRGGQSNRAVQHGVASGATSRFGSSNNYNGYNDNNGRVNLVPNTGINTANSGFDPAFSQGGFNRPVSTGTAAGADVGSNVGYKPNTGGNSQSTGAERSPGATNNNEVFAGKANDDGNTRAVSDRTSSISRNAGLSSSSLSNNGADAGPLRGHGFSSSSDVGASKVDSRISVGLGSTGAAAVNAGTNAAAAVVTTVKRRVVKGQTVVLPCPSQGSPPPRLAWLLPGNGVLPAPYYGSRLTVHRNGSLELRGVRVNDAGTLICVVRSEGGERRIQVKLEVSEQQEDESPNRGPLVERRVQETAAPPSKISVDSAQTLISSPKIPGSQTPQKAESLPAAPLPVGPPLRSSGPVSEPAVSTSTAPLVSIINGETLRLTCSAPQTRGYNQDSLSWTMPSGKKMSRGESGDSGRYHVQQDGTLVVQQASVFDRGTYTCRLTSYDSSSVSAITFPVIVIAYPPRITVGPSPVTYTRPGVAVELPCLTIATPRATVTWETPDLTQLRVMGQARIYGNRYLSPQGSLVIQNPTSRDTGFYRCTAKNVIGVDTKSTYLHVI